MRSVSLARIRLSILFFVLWWLPLYLMAPFIADTFGNSANSHDTATITLVIVIIQTILGVLGVLLAGMELISPLQQVRLRKMPLAIWRAAKSGQINLDSSMLKKSAAAPQR